MSTELAVRDHLQMTTLDNEQLKYIATTEFVPPGLRGNLPAILACVATGRALGIADMTALRSIHIIDGKATFSAELMVQLVRRNGHSITGDVTEGSATVKGKRADNGDEMQATWTLAMADRAGLLRKQNWVKYPEAMLWARAASQLCRMLFADCFAGATYTTEELGEEHTGAGGVPDGDSAAGTPFSYDAEPLVPSEVPPLPPASEGAPNLFASEKQRKLMFAKAKEAGLDTPGLKAIIREHTGQESSAQITRDVFEKILGSIDAATVSA